MYWAGLGTVLVQMLVEQLYLKREQVFYDASNTYNAPDSGTTSGSRQTLVTGEALRRACRLLKKGFETQSLAKLEGKRIFGRVSGQDRRHGKRCEESGFPRGLRLCDAGLHPG